MEIPATSMSHCSSKATGTSGASVISARFLGWRAASTVREWGQNLSPSISCADSFSWASKDCYYFAPVDFVEALSRLKSSHDPLSLLDLRLRTIHCSSLPLGCHSVSCQLSRSDVQCTPTFSFKNTRIFATIHSRTVDSLVALLFSWYWIIRFQQSCS